MAADMQPVAGNWYCDAETRRNFQVVRNDEGGGRVQIRYGDGDTETLAAWYELDLEPGAPTAGEETGDAHARQGEDPRVTRRTGDELSDDDLRRASYLEDRRPDNGEDVGPGDEWAGLRSAGDSLSVADIGQQEPDRRSRTDESARLEAPPLASRARPPSPVATDQEALRAAPRLLAVAVAAAAARSSPRPCAMALRVAAARPVTLRSAICCACSVNS